MIVIDVHIDYRHYLNLIIIIILMPTIYITTYFDSELGLKQAPSWLTSFPLKVIMSGIQ